MVPYARGLLILFLTGTAPGLADGPQPVSDAASRTQDWPAGMPVASLNGSWERFSGVYTVAPHDVSYQLYVDPARPGLYRVTRYVVSAPPGSTGDEALPMETVIFNANPGLASLICYQRRVAAGPPRLWVTLELGSAALRAEMLRAIQVYHRHHPVAP